MFDNHHFEISENSNLIDFSDLIGVSDLNNEASNLEPDGILSAPNSDLNTPIILKNELLFPKKEA